MKSCARLLIGLSAALLLMAPLTRGQRQRTLLRGRLPGLGEVNVTVGEKPSGETMLVHAVTHKGLTILFLTRVWRKINELNFLNFVHWFLFRRK